ncbi:MAG: DNA polymerase III subunit delta [Muribaculaceae bacterium]|nr:DNA polymerase III subunit delta [Muribaculaceae bacterium]
MAKQASSAQSPRDIISDIRKGNLNPVYILQGDEPYYLDLITANLEKYVIPEEERDFNYSVFFGQDTDIDYLIAAAKQFPVMSDRRLVILREAQSMERAKIQLERLAPYIEKPAPATVFVVVYKGEPFSTSSKLMKAAKAGGAIVFNSPLPRDYEVLSHLRAFCQDNKISIEEKAMQMLCEYLGTPLSKLFGEVKKLVQIASGRQITADDVKKHTGISKEYGGYDFVDALGRKDYTKAVRIIKYFEETNNMESIIKSVGLIFNYFANLVIAHYLPDKSEASLRDNLGLKAQVQLRSLAAGMRNYNPAQAVNAIHYIREFDAKYKGIDSASNRYDLLHELVFKLFT